MYMLSVPASCERGTLVLHPVGEIDLHTAPALADAVREVTGPWRELVVDLSGVSFMDSAGLHALIGLSKCCRERGGRLALTGVREQSARLLDLTGLSGVFPNIA
ncbi:STAS domain-containing protein [Streptomyces sp. DH37]|uniref:STAS domain-containing protein n=1 Tax=Streptomyces sp. DH37 TaxID=3040122 RepID=UPI002440F57A|nr:STAS domain-containing protein [Streptomyces sp. DH37]MDG9702598.1 STAS domain-containing protein [Streptomyces sp. DH37]